MKLMHKNLKYNTCNMQIDDHVSSFSDKKISPALQYSCKHWISHLIRCDSVGTELLVELEKFIRKCFFFWMEDLCILHSIEQAIPGLQSVSNWLKTYNSEGTEFLQSVIYEG